VRAVDGGRRADATPRDHSLSGARIELPFPLEPMKKLDQIVDEHEQRLRCTVRWYSGNQIGVSFYGAPSLVPSRGGVSGFARGNVTSM
jgi:hypothetical protein